MYSVKLFFGVPISGEIAAKLSLVNPDLLSLFVQNEDHYLREAVIQNQRYMGKSIENAVDLASLELLQANIFSLLKKILPDYPIEKHPLILLPLQDANEQ